jgi:hypothetical protein
MLEVTVAVLRAVVPLTAAEVVAATLAAGRVVRAGTAPTAVADVAGRPDAVVVVVV